MFDRILPQKELNPHGYVLNTLMREISEDCYCAGWMMGLEISLWELMMSGGGSYGMGLVSRTWADQLLHYAMQSGGWWYWPEKDGDLLTHSEQFTDLGSWQAEFEKYHAWHCDFRRRLAVVSRGG